MATAFLTKERSDLNAPGTAIGSVYYTNASTEVQLVEIDFTNGKYTQSLNSLNFGSVSNIIIPNDNLITDIYLHMRLPDIVANQSISRGWALDILKEINFTWGASNVSNLRLDNASIRQLCLSSCETKEKRDETLEIAGAPFIRVGGASNIYPIEGCVKLPLPFTSGMSAFRKKPFDMSLLNSPINIQITLDTSDRIFGGTGVRPIALLSGEVFTTMGQFADKANSLKNRMMMDPSYIYEFPFIYHQSVSPKSNIQLRADLSVTNVVDLQEMLNSDLTAILFSVTPNNVQRATGTICPSGNLTCELFNIHLLYNGQTIYKVPGRASRLLGMNYDHGASGYTSTIQKFDAGAPGGSVTEPHQSFIYHIPLGQMKGINFERLFENVSRYPSQTFQLSFQAIPIAGTDPVDAVGTLSLTYCYNSSASIQNGTTSIMFG